MSKPKGNTKEPKPGKQPTTDIVGEIGTEQIASKEPDKEQPIEKGAISIERWHEAQQAEREQHTMEYMAGLLHYANSYKHCFALVGLGTNLGNLNVIEVGPADFPALNQCSGEGALIIVEPMPSEHLKKICEEKKIDLTTSPFESLDVELMRKALVSTGRLTEVWLFNVMQHVIDPDKFIEKAKLIADRIRFIEPVDQPITSYHPHTFTLTDYQKYFGDCVQLYAGGSIEKFHEADCAYGVWVKE